MCGTDTFCAYNSPSHLTRYGALLSCPSPTLFWETEKMNYVKTCVRIPLLQAEGFYKQLEMYATFLSEGHNSLKYFYSQTALPSPHVCLVYQRSKPQELLHSFRSRAVGSWICRNHPVPLLSPRGIASPCTPSSPSSALSSSLTKWLIQGLSVRVLLQQHSRKVQHCVQQHGGTSVCSLL